MPYPFEVDFTQIQANLDVYVDEVFGCLTSEFLVMPKGAGFVEFAAFDAGYESLKRATRNFEQVDVDHILPAIYQTPITLIVLRCMLGFTPPEWAYIATHQTGVEINQGAARTIDRKIRMNPTAPLLLTGSVTDARIRALVEAACHILEGGAPTVAADRLHRINKPDTAYRTCRNWLRRHDCVNTAAASSTQTQRLPTRPSHKHRSRRRRYRSRSHPCG